MLEIRYMVGDATDPDVDGPLIIAHGCNSHGAWGAGFVIAVSQRWPEVRNAYLEWFEDAPPGIGDVQFVQVDLTPGSPVWVANMITQTLGGAHPFSEAGFEECLKPLSQFALKYGASVIMPRIGCGLAGSNWGRVGPLVKRGLCAKDIPVYVYDLPQR